MSGHADRIAALTRAIDAARRDDGLRVGLAKSTSNLFRERPRTPRPRVDLSGFRHVVRVDAEEGIVEAEGMTTFVDLADATLAHGTMPLVVPQLKSITLGGAVAGVGIESSSFRHGLVHDAIVAMDVITADGDIVHCTPENEHRDLFLGFPNSYGTLGYAIALACRTQPVERFVRLDHARFDDPDACFAAIARECAEPTCDFLDGVAFGPQESYLTRARFVADAPCASDYGYERIYYRSIRERTTDHLRVRDYLWRWDTDWFWCSANVGAQHPLVRRLLGRRRLNSVTYQRLMRLNGRLGATRALDRLRGVHAESVIQDVDIPVENAATFLAFLQREVGLAPIWLCPIRAADPARRATLYPLPPTATVNFGFWGVVRTRESRAPGALNRAIEREVARLGGVKSLYSDAYYDERTFDAVYAGAAYDALKRRYDPNGRLPRLYDKCVRRR